MLLADGSVAGQYVVSRVVPGGPAANSGNVQVGDVVVQLDGRRVEGQSVETVRNMIIGPIGTEVDVHLMRQDQGRFVCQNWVNVWDSVLGPSR